MSKTSLPSEKPTLETLLKFKRREQPAAAFWNDFDRALESRLTREFVSQQRRWDKRVWWVKLSAGFSLAASVTVAFLMMDAPARYLAQETPLALAAHPVELATAPAPSASPAVEVPPVPQGVFAVVAPVVVEPAAPVAHKTLPVSDIVPAPSPVLDRAVLRETSFAALKQQARPAVAALLASSQQADGYTKVWAKTALAENEDNARFVPGTTPAYAALPGVATYVSCAY